MSKDICLCKVLFLHGVPLTLAWLCMRYWLTKATLFFWRHQFLRTNPQIPLSSFHFTEQAGWNCLSALQGGELELMLWKLGVVFPWNTDIFRLQHFDVSFKNKQADTISIFLQSWCFSKCSLFSLGWHTILEDQLCVIITILPIKVMVPDTLYYIPLQSQLHWEHHLHVTHTFLILLLRFCVKEVSPRILVWMVRRAG